MGTVIHFTSCQAPNADGHIRAVVEYLGRRLGIETRFPMQLAWQERQRRLDQGEIQIGWICGWPYIRRADQPDSPVRLLAAPVMQGARYHDRPIYYSDVVVRSDSRVHTFASLRGATFAYNEPHSHSGYNIVRYTLAVRNLDWSFFGKVVESGAHQESLRRILAGEVDASVIDSTVLETELAEDPALAGQIRVLESLGPSPIPPWVVHAGLDEGARSAVRDALVEMHSDMEGRQILAAGRMLRFARVEDLDYNPIRQMTSLADDAGL